jgi:hypothetical protein
MNTLILTLTLTLTLTTTLTLTLTLTLILEFELHRMGDRSHKDSERNKRHDESRSNSRSRERERSPKEDSKKDSKKDSKNNSKDGSNDDDDVGFVFEFSAVQLANMFLEIYSGVKGPASRTSKKSDNSEDEEDEEDKSKAKAKKRLDLIAQLFSESAAVLSLKSGKEMLSGKKAIRNSFARTLPEEAKCCYRIVVNVKPEGNDEKEGKEEIEAEKGNEDKEGTVSYCLDFHAPKTSPGLGDRTKDTALLYRCQNQLLTHIWGAVDPDKLSSNPNPNQKSSGNSNNPNSNSVEMSIVTILKSKCWGWAELLIRKDFPLFSNSVDGDDNDLIFQDYNNIESWG